MKLRYFFSAIVALALAFPALASAQNVPADVPIQTYLTDSNGVPVDGTETVKVEIFDAQSGGSSVFSTTKNNVQFTNGSATIHLTSISLSVFENNKDLWAELTVGSETLSPRLRIGTAPYAAVAGTAQNAEQLGGQSASDYNYSAGTGLQKSGTTFSVDPSAVQNRVTGTCGSGKAIHTINQDGTVGCRSVASNLTAGNGISISGGTISIASGGVTSSMIASNTIQQGDIDSGAVGTSELQNNAVTSSEIDNGTITSDDVDSSFTTSEVAFDSGGSLHIPSGEIHGVDIASGAVDSSEIAFGAVGSSEIQSGAVGSSEISDGSITGDDIGDYPCDSSTTFEEVISTDCNGISDPEQLPRCNEVPVGGMCDSDPGSVCSNAPANANCDGSSVWIRTSW